jgi:hypothetical protein
MEKEELARWGRGRWVRALMLQPGELALTGKEQKCSPHYLNYSKVPHFDQQKTGL